MLRERASIEKETEVCHPSNGNVDYIFSQLYAMFRCAWERNPRHFRRMFITYRIGIHVNTVYIFHSIKIGVLPFI